MSKVLHIRDVPDKVHKMLVRRAEAHGQSLRQYVIQVLEQHCALPTMDEWLAELDRLPPVNLKEKMSGAQAVHEARAEDDERLDRAWTGR